MVWCPEHNRYISGRRDREYHIKKFDCDFIREHKPNRKTLIKINTRNPANKNPELKSKYIWKRERGKRSIYRTNKMKGK